MSGSNIPRTAWRTAWTGAWFGSAALAVAATVACRASAPDSSWTPAIEEVASPAQGASASPQLTVSGGRTLLSWLESGNFRHTLKYAERTDQGWSEPVTVVTGDTLFHNAADVPSVRVLADGRVFAAWIETDARHPLGTNLRLAWSSDGGRTWSAPTPPHHDGTPSQHGFAALFEAPDGFGIAWLDGRATDPELPEGENGNMALWTATFGSGGAQTGEVEIDSRVCDCCQTSAASTSTGPLVVYRDRSEQEIRDIAVSRLVGGRWTTPAVVHEDGWKIRGCPVNGPAVAARDRDVAVAWFTGATGRGEVFVAFSHDAGATFGPPTRVHDEEGRGQVDVELLADGSAAVAWREIVDEGSELRLRRVTPTGGASSPITIARLAGPHYPRLAAYGPTELVLAWVEADAGYTRVRTARARLP
jgi:hypothetical protein